MLLLVRGAQVINASVPHSRSSGSLIDVQRSDPAASPARPSPEGVSLG